MGRSSSLNHVLKADGMFDLDQEYVRATRYEVSAVKKEFCAVEKFKLFG
jgi:hypothetical protein